jgi:hypothetical protein
MPEVSCWMSVMSALLSGLIFGLMIGWSWRGKREKVWLTQTLRGAMRRELRIPRGEESW